MFVKFCIVYYGVDMIKRVVTQFYKFVALLYILRRAKIRNTKSGSSS